MPLLYHCVDPPVEYQWSTYMRKLVRFKHCVIRARTGKNCKNKRLSFCPSIEDLEEHMQQYSSKELNLASVGYDKPSQTLEIEFVDRSVYQYYNVPANIHEELMRECSKGEFFRKYVLNAYPYSRVD